MATNPHAPYTVKIGEIASKKAGSRSKRIFERRRKKRSRRCSRGDDWGLGRLAMTANEGKKKRVVEINFSKKGRGKNDGKGRSQIRTHTKRERTKRIWLVFSFCVGRRGSRPTKKGSGLAVGKTHGLLNRQSGIKDKSIGIDAADTRAGGRLEHAKDNKKSSQRAGGHPKIPWAFLRGWKGSLKEEGWSGGEKRLCYS